KRLLDHFGVSRQDVQTIGDASSNECRRFLSTELMRPAATAEKWQDLATNAKAMNMAKEAIKDLKYFICDNERQEAALIALLFREALITKERTAALITPDRNLARRVAAACRRWHIQVDDSAGRPLHQTPVGIYLRLCLQVGLTRLAP